MIGGILKLNVGNGIPISKLKDKEIVGKDGRSGMGITIGGIAIIGKSHAPITSYRAALTEVEANGTAVGGVIGGLVGDPAAAAIAAKAILT